MIILYTILSFYLVDFLYNKTDYRKSVKKF
nr:MAG TPA: hypothetical protein [Caudoviricetes sp.]DAJ45713.1 MAG TPA: hypothetical protein [Caudoviricetes sp.]